MQQPDHLACSRDKISRRIKGFQISVIVSINSMISPKLRRNCTTTVRGCQSGQSEARNAPSLSQQENPQKNCPQSRSRSLGNKHVSNKKNSFCAFATCTCFLYSSCIRIGFLKLPSACIPISHFKASNLMPLNTEHYCYLPELSISPKQEP